jgi:hypothetical protein
MEQPNEVHLAGKVQIIDVTVDLPVVPLYDAKFSATLVPCLHQTLIQFVNDHKDLFPVIYRRTRNRKRIRMLTGEQIRLVRSMMLDGPGLAATNKPYRMPTAG